VAVSTSMRRERKAPACATCMMIWYDMVQWYVWLSAL
jgi:hypothetical protein